MKYPCGCADGLECKITKVFELLGVAKYHTRTCQPVDKPVTPEVVELGPEGVPQKDRRFLGGILPTLPPLPTVPPIFRVSSSDGRIPTPKSRQAVANFKNIMLVNCQM